MTHEVNTWEHGLTKQNVMIEHKHNGKPLHDRERLVRQSLENISKASLDVSGCPSLGIFGGLWRSLGVFGGLWGSLGIFGVFSVLMQDKSFPFSHARWDILVPHPRWDLVFLILHETFGFSYPTWDFWVFLSYMRFSAFLSYIRNLCFLILHEIFGFLILHKKSVLSIRKHKQIIQFDQVWTNFIYFGPICSILKNFDPVWTCLKMFEHVWTSLINMD